MLGQLIRFGAVGAVATLAHVLAALMAERTLPVSAQGANLVGFATAVLVSYTGHTRVTFDAPLRSGPQFGRFLVLSLLSLAASSLTVWVVTGPLGLGFAAAMAVVALIVPAVTYLAMRLWVFHSEGQKGGGIAWEVFAIPAVVVAAMSILFRGQSLTNDVAWYLIATRDWLEGSPLYETIMEVNPPLNFYLTVPAILAADHLGISDSNGQYLVIWVLLFLILSWCSAIIRADAGLSPLHQSLLVLGTAAAIIIPALDSVGQREFYLVALMMPWLLQQVPPREPTARETVAAAAIAAVGVCLKPHFVLLPMALTLAQCVRDRSLWPVLSVSNLTFLVIGLAYVGFVAIVHPLYLTEVVPIAGLVYGAYDASPLVVAGVVLPEAVFLLLPAAVALADREGRLYPHPFVAVSLAGLLSYLLQGKGFAYHMIPFQTFGLMACFMILLNLRRVGAFAVATGAAASGVIGLSISQGFHVNYSVDQVKILSTKLGGFDSVMALTPHVFAGPPVALETGADWASRYPANWLVPGALNRLAKTDCSAQAATCVKLEAIIDRNRSDNIADMIAHRPELLIVDLDSEYFDTPRFDWLAFMAEDPEWPRVFADYRYYGESIRYRYYIHSP
jgi:putative flippase GtrA